MSVDLDDVVVRPIGWDEYGQVREVSVRAFGDDAQIGALLDALRASWAWSDDRCFVAVHAGEIVGQVLYSSALLDAPRRLVDVLVLGPVGIRPDLQRRGIGSHLIRTTLGELAERPDPAPLVFVEGHPGYYGRFGFRQGGEHGFRKPSERVPDDAFMALPMRGYERWMTGTLVYPDAFWRTDSVGLRQRIDTYSFRQRDNEVTLGAGVNRIEGGWTGSIDLTIANPIGEAGPIADDPAPADLGVLDEGRFVIDGNSVRYDGPMLKQPANDGANRHRSRSGTAW